MPSSGWQRRRKDGVSEDQPSDLNWIFTIQTERVAAKDNTVAMGSRNWQIGKTRFRHTLAGSMVTIHEHLDGTVSIRYGPHVAIITPGNRWPAGANRAVEKTGAPTTATVLSKAKAKPKTNKKAA